MAHDEFEKRTKDPNFVAIQARVRAAVENDPHLRARIDTNERAFCSVFDRVSARAQEERLKSYVAPRRTPLPAAAEPSQEESRRASLLERARTGGLHEAGELLDYIEKTRPKED